MNLFVSGIKLVLLALLLQHGLSFSVHAQTVEQSRLEAAMTLRLLSFASWPDSKTEDEDDKVIRIGIFENPAKLQEFATLLRQEANPGRFELRRVGPDASDQELNELDALVFGQTASRETARMLRRIEGRPIVLIGSFEGFLEIGGMVNFTRSQRRLGFEIDVGRARAHQIEFRSKLLRLATRIVGE